MLIIQDKLVEEDIVESYFACELNACKGACCWEGDFGAPIDDHEAQKLEEILEKLLPYLDQESKDIIDANGVSTYYEEIKTLGTPLKVNGDCVYLVRNDGIAFCGIERAYYDGKVDFIKPLSCHLYPIRVAKDAYTGFETLSYNRWHICKPACTNGRKRGIPLFEFVKTAIVRKYGDSFFEELTAAADYLKEA